MPPQPPEPKRAPRTRTRTVSAAICLVLGIGLLTGAVAGNWLTGDAEDQPTAETAFADARDLWREKPVDKLFPQRLRANSAGPGGAERRWIRAAVAPDSACERAFDELLTKVLSPVGCRRLVRATYIDETSSSVTTVGVLFTRADPAGMRDLRDRFAGENLTQRTDLMPRPYAARGTDSAGFGDAQRATWTIRVRTDAPIVIYAVTGFVDGRIVSEPQPAAEATEKGETTAPAQAGLGHDAQGIADRIERGILSLSQATGTAPPATGDGTEEDR
ncbi:hypothetical protein [Streptomyces gobiensis]|uniref:hypothetical protein n=1 Tax=Streptomyces gobiensis TaxID=2875706 RepID=UPI001E5E1F4E|nr:hypothetical protein [Streptomyces gobiensis]UGY90471.1 hypothetical protein test1122_01165 [Streptomyces gobiensis]